MNQDLAAAVKRVADVVMFENWLRFYFISEEDDKLMLRLPEKAMEQLRTRYAQFYGLAEYLNNMEVTHQTSLNAVCMFVASEMEGTVLPDKVIAKVFDSHQFQVNLQLFSTWVQTFEEQLDRGFLEFSVWCEQFSKWKENDDVREYGKRLSESMTFANMKAPETSQ